MSDARFLRYDLFAANLIGEFRHATEVMHELGITYQCATPQSMADSWWFWNCEKIPDQLPSYIEERDVDPMKRIGFGLSMEQAKSIRDYKND